MLNKIIVVLGYLAICSLCASTWVDSVAEELKSTAGKISFCIIFLICPFLWLYLSAKTIVGYLKKPGDR